MYWEEVIELIKTHGKEPKSKFPNKYNDSDRHIVYEYERGTVKTSYLHINEFSKKIKKCLPPCRKKLWTFFHIPGPKNLLYL